MRLMVLDRGLRRLALWLAQVPLLGLSACGGDDDASTGSRSCTGLSCPCTQASDCPNPDEVCVDSTCLNDTGDAGGDTTEISPELAVHRAEAVSVLRDAGIDPDDAIALRRVWSEGSGWENYLDTFFTSRGVERPPDRNPTASCASLELYSETVGYCGPGCGSSAVNPGTCANRACLEHDRCYGAMECDTNEEIGPECTFGADTFCCDDRMMEVFARCALDGEVPTDPVEAVLFAAVVGLSAQMIDTADVITEAFCGLTLSTAACEPSPDGWYDLACDVPSGFVRIEPGTFTMGSPEDELGRRSSDETQHTVTLTRAFLLQATEVTQGDYEALMGSNPSMFDDCGASCPVEMVSWFDAIDYANALSSAEGLPRCYEWYDWTGAEILADTVYDCVGYRLPTEAEWEYAARAGTAAATYLGELEGDPYGCDPQPSLDSIAWFCGNSAQSPHPVGSKLPNAWGLYDMLGNVSEWTSDWHGPYSGGGTDPSGSSTGPFRVVRGGDWMQYPSQARAARRGWADPVNMFDNNTGFRLARSLP